MQGLLDKYLRSKGITRYYVAKKGQIWPNSLLRASKKETTMEISNSVTKAVAMALEIDRAKVIAEMEKLEKKG